MKIVTVTKCFSHHITTNHLQPIADDHVSNMISHASDVRVIQPLVRLTQYQADMYRDEPMYKHLVDFLDSNEIHSVIQVTWVDGTQVDFYFTTEQESTAD